MAGTAMVAGALLSASFTVLMEKLASPQVLNFFRHQKLDDRLLRKLELQLISVDRLLVDAEEKQIKNPNVKKWLNNLKHAVYEADDFLDELGVEMEAPAQESTTQLLDMIDFLDLRQNKEEDMASKLKELVQTFEDILEAKDALGLTPGNLVGNQERTLALLNRQTTSLVDDSSVFGRGGDKEAIVKLLLSDDAGSACPGVVSVVGMGGIGKTTLAQLVFNDNRVEGRFDKLKVWVCVSEEVDVIKLTKNILKEIGLFHCDSMTPNQLQLELQEKVKGERILLVMDDVWNNIDWESLLKPLKSVARGSKILVTTRQERVLSKVKGVSSHQLKVLNEEDCWSLFANHAFDGHNSEADPELKELGTKIIRKCKGLPLAVKTIGSLLCSAREWETVLKSNIWDLDDDDKIIPALKLSYHYLPSPLKQCFAYCAMFPKDYLFEKEELILLWMAEGFIIQNNNDKRELEEIGETYFEDLLSRSFFQKDDENYVMHDLLNDLAKSIAGDFCCNNVDANSGKFPEKTRHLFYKVEDECNVSEKLENISKAECLRTFICSEKMGEFGDAVDCLSRFKRLRALELGGNRSPNMSHLDSSAKHLRYMRLYYLPIPNLPETMPYLQTLIMRGCRELTSLPDSIGDMKNLRHLTLDATEVKSLPNSIGNLKDLRHLSLKETKIESLPDLIGNLKNLRHLNLESTGIESLPDSIGTLKYLRHLNLESTRIKSLPDSISNLKYLRHLNLDYTSVQSLPDSIGNLKNLRHLALQLTDIESLPDSIGNLKNLRHLDLQWTGIESLPDSIGDLKCLRHLDLGETLLKRLPDSICDLPNLQHLSVNGCEQLVELPAKMSDLVDLCHLDIRDTTLKSMPPQMGKLIKLQTLSYFVVGIEEGSSIAELVHFQNLQGELDLRNLQNVEDEHHALKAKIKNNNGLQKLSYVWKDDDNSNDNVDRSLLHHLEPHVNIKNIFIEGYRGIDFPNWVVDSSFSNIVELRLYDCKYCTRLPPLGQLASLEDLSIGGFDSLVLVGAEFYGSFNSVQPFRSLIALTFNNMPKLQQWSCYENETEEDDLPLDYAGLHHLTSLRRLEISDCPNLDCIPDEGLPESLTKLYINGCPLLEERCRKEQGEYWPKISHIERIYIDDQEIQGPEDIEWWLWSSDQTQLYPVVV